MARKILILSDLDNTPTVQKVRRIASHHIILLAKTPNEAEILIERDNPDLIVIDEVVAEAQADFWSKKWAVNSKTQHTPILRLCEKDLPSVRILALHYGATEAMLASVPDAVLSARLRSLLRRATRSRQVSDWTQACQPYFMAEPETGFQHQSNVTIVCDDYAMGQYWQQAIQPMFPARFAIIDHSDALTETKTATDIYLFLASGASEAWVASMIAEMRTQPRVNEPAFCLMLPNLVPEQIAAAWDRGIEEVVTATIAPNELALRLRKLNEQKQANDRMRSALTKGLQLAVTDPLTGLSNRRVATPALEKALSDATLNGQRCAVMMLDIDRFKDVNDRYGHPAGDRVLIEVARVLRQGLQEGETLARIGGEEFLLIVPSAFEAHLKERAEGYRQALSKVTFPFLDTARITLSIGIALSDAQTESSADLIARADRELLKAKTHGRNQVRMCQRSAA